MLMNKLEVIEFLKENLTIHVEQDTGCYGEGGFNRIVLKLGEDEISSDYIELNNTLEGNI